MKFVILLSLLAVAAAEAEAEAKADPKANPKAEAEAEASYATKTVSHAVAAPVLVRGPAHDSAIIQSHRLGGNFAYSAHEAHAYAEHKPIIGHRTVPVGVSYHKGAPVVHSTTKYVTAQVPQVGYEYSSYPVSYSEYPQYGYQATPDYGYQAAPAYGYETPAYGYDASPYDHNNVVTTGYKVSAPVFSHSVATPLYHDQHRADVVVPAYAIGQSYSPVQSHSTSHGHSHGSQYHDDHSHSHGSHSHGSHSHGGHSHSHGSQYHDDHSHSHGDYGHH